MDNSTIPLEKSAGNSFKLRVSQILTGFCYVPYRFKCFRGLKSSGTETYVKQ